MRIEPGEWIETTTGLAQTVLLFYTDDDIKDAIETGRKKAEYRRRAGSQHYGKKVLTAERIEANHEFGDSGEFLCVEYFKQFYKELRFDRSIGPVNNVDLQIMELRSRRIEPGRRFPDLTIRPKDGAPDKAHLPNILLRIDEARKRAEIIGWLLAWQALERANEWCDEKGVYFVKPPYHSVRSLEQWLECGHRRFWTPHEVGQRIALARMKTFLPFFD